MENEIPLISEGTNIRVALATTIMEVRLLTRDALPKAISKETRFFRGTPGQLEQKAASFGKAYIEDIDKVIRAFARVVEKKHPSLRPRIEKAHQIFDRAFEDEIHQMAERIHKAPTFEKAQAAALNYLNGSFKKNIEEAFQTLANSMEDMINREVA